MARHDDEVASVGSRRVGRSGLGLGQPIFTKNGSLTILSADPGLLIELRLPRTPSPGGAGGGTRTRGSRFRRGKKGANRP
jgi:hypothetical protein